MEDGKRSFDFSDYKKIRNNPLISKEMLDFVRKKVASNKKQISLSTGKPVKTLKGISPELMAKVIKDMLQGG